MAHKLKHAPNYETWFAYASDLERRNKMDVWKEDPRSQLYDYKLIQSRIQSFRAARLANDIPAMKLLIRSGLLRNLGGICDNRLFVNCLTGTKKLIEEYLNEVLVTMRYINELDPDSMSAQQKVLLFSEVEQSFGHTALLLHGGATFGLYHLGVVKALNEAKLLPRIISGSSVGALIAALICVHTEDELPMLFVPGGIDLAAFGVKKAGSIRRKIVRLLTKGHLLDVKVLEDCVRSNLGDITFEEAYNRTGMILNITLANSLTTERPQIFNHLTTPNVLIRSAACGSASTFGLYSSVDLLAKNSDGQIFVWAPSSVRWISSYNNESPAHRISELFNVNQFILSQAQPYIAPFLNQTKSDKFKWLSKITGFISSEISFRVEQLSQYGLFPTRFDFTVSGHVTISPPLSSLDFYTIFSNPTYESLSYWIKKGERSTWPYIAMIRNRLLIEKKLSEINEGLKVLIPTSDDAISITALKKRTLSLG